MSARVALGIRVVAAMAGGAAAVARPHGVVHLYQGVLTPAGSVPASGRPYCGTRTRRLRAVATSADGLLAALAGRRFCRSCTRRLPARLGAPASTLVTRDDWYGTFSGLTVADVQLAAAWSQSVEDADQVQRLLMMLHGPRPMVPRPKLDPARLALLTAYDTVASRRKALVAAGRTNDEVAAARAAREAEAHNRALAEKARRRDAWLDRLAEKQRAGSYLAPHEREALRSA